MACNCIDSVNELLKPHNSELVHTLGFGGTPCRTVIQTSKIASKQRGQAKAMLATFCPFCGERYAPAPPSPESSGQYVGVSVSPLTPEDSRRPSTPEDGQAVHTR